MNIIIIYSVILVIYYIIANQESRVLKFWFSPETEYFDRVTCAYEFFKELVRPENFPRGSYQIYFIVYTLHQSLCATCISSNSSA